ncbi:hypothetical protein T05_913 [Trichinella murrelli]|uniref:Uncharacterized protein n=1 Tax=Trichinella murrelli TaxID=144512 RepID=A0A0V0UGP4_9BILA|nr:hypothetical protein T05_913 [Trichinella murrelli]
MKIIRVALLCNELNGIGSRRGILSSPRQAFNKFIVERRRSGIRELVLKCERQLIPNLLH